MNIGEGGHRHARREGGGIELVIGVEGEDDVQHPRHLGRRGPAFEEVEEVRGVRAVAGAGHRLAPRPDAVPRRHRLRDQRHQPDRLAALASGSLDRTSGSRTGGQGDRGAERVQRVAVAGQGTEQRRHLGGQPARPRERRREGAAGRGLGQLAVPEELGDLLERDRGRRGRRSRSPGNRGAPPRRPPRRSPTVPPPRPPGPPSSPPASPSRMAVPPRWVAGPGFGVD